MKEHIDNFPTYIQAGNEIPGNEIQNFFKEKNSKNIVFLGMGGSRMAAKLTQTLIDTSKQGIPTSCISDYSVPQWINQHTCVIAISYSGNTEEVLDALQQAHQQGAQCITVSSGGKLAEYCQDNNQLHIELPSGLASRAGLPYSLGALLRVVSLAGLTEADITTSIKNFIRLIGSQKEQCDALAESISKNIHDKLPVIYTTDEYESVALRLHQQLNENSKTVCRHQLIPEVNHNELLGWETETHNAIGVFITHPNQRERNQQRIELMKIFFERKGIPTIDLPLQGDSLLIQLLYGVYLSDLISFHTAQLKNVSADESQIVSRFKNELSKKK